MLYPPKNGAYTELFAGLSDTIDEKNNGGWRKLFPLPCGLSAHVALGSISPREKKRKDLPC